jgi:hypothetical protein
VKVNGVFVRFFVRRSIIEMINFLSTSERLEIYYLTLLLLFHSMLNKFYSFFNITY